jgi:hypothetical protein
MKRTFSEIAERVECGGLAPLCLVDLCSPGFCGRYHSGARPPHSTRSANLRAQLKNVLFITAAVLLLSSICIAQTREQSPTARHQTECDESPARRLILLSLFDLVSVVTGPPFNFFPALGGADKTKFVNDRLINRDELTHLIAFLEFQVNGPDKLQPPESAALHTQMLGAAEALRENFDRLATRLDAQGSRAIGPEAVRRFVSCLAQARPGAAG